MSNLQLFSELNISDNLKKGVQDLGYVSPTEFQRDVLKNFLAGQNVLCDGQSNYGKSLACCLPILAHIDPNHDAIQALILCETQAQCDINIKECKALGRYADIITGNALSSTKTPHILVWSLDDLYKQGISDFQISVRYIFFDGLSSDNMTKAMTILAGILQRGVQILAYGNEAVGSLKNNHDISKGEIVTNNDKPKISSVSSHIFHLTKDSEPKPKALLAALLWHNPKYALVSVNDAQECELLSRYLSKHGFKSLALSEEANRVSFKDAWLQCVNQGEILLCQNSLLASQNLETVPLMINYDMFDRPQVYEEITQYKKQASGVNRVIVSLISSRELGCLGPIKAQCQINFTEVPLVSDQEKILDLCVNRIILRINEEAKDIELSQYEDLAGKLLSHHEALNPLAYLLKKYLSSSSASNIPSKTHEPHELRERKTRYHHKDTNQERASHESYNKDHQDNNAPKSSPDGISRLYLTLGRKDGFVDLAALVQYVSQLSHIDMGHFSGGGMIRDTSAHIEVDEEVAEAVINAINNTARPDNQEGDMVICEHAKGVRPRSNHRYMPRRKPHYHHHR